MTELTNTERQLVEMWNAGEKTLFIALELSMSPSTVTTWRKRLGLEARNANPSRYTPQQLEKIEQLYVGEGKSCEQIAQILGRGWNKNMVVGIVFRRRLKKKPRAPKALKPKPAAAPRTPKAAKVKAQLPATGEKAKPFDLARSRSDSTPQQRAEKSAQGQEIIARVERSEVKSPNATPFLQATRGCKWPIGSGLAMLYCCNPVVGGVGAAKVYCEGHHEMAVSSIQPYRPRSPVSSFTRHDRIATPKPKPANDPFGSIWDDGRAVA